MRGVQGNIKCVAIRLDSWENCQNPNKAGTIVAAEAEQVAKDRETGDLR